MALAGSLVGLYSAIAFARHQGIAPGEMSVRGNHLRNELIEAAGWCPTELTPGFRRVAEQGVDLRGPEVPWIDPHDRMSALAIDPLLLEALAAPFQAHAEEARGLFGELAHRVLDAGRNDEVLRRVLLQHPPLRFHVVARVTPVAACVEVAEVDAVLQPLDDAGHPPSDFP